MRGLVAATPVAVLCSAFVCVAIAFGEPAAPQSQDQTKSQAPQPKQESITLDPVNIQKAKTTQRKKQQQKAAVRAPAPQTSQPPAAAPETAYSNVKGYVAGRSSAGTKTDTPIREVPQSITVVTTDRMQDQGVTTVQDALRYIPGVTADPYGVDSRNDAVRIRGSYPEWYLDGMRVVNSWWNGQRADPYTLSRVEVLRGPSSVLYGSSTTAGLINMVSKRPQEQELHEIGVQYGSFNRKQVQTDHTGKITADGQWLYRFVGIWRDSDMQTDHVPDNRIVAMPSITWRPTKDTDWTVIALYQKDRTGSSTAFLPHSGTIFANPNGKIPVNRFTSEPGFDRYQTETKSITSLFEHRFSDAFKINQSTRVSHVDGVYNTLYPDNYSNPGNPYLDPVTRRTVARYAESLITSRDILNSDTNGELKFATGPLTHKVLAGIDFRRMRETGLQGFSYIATPFDLYAPTYGNFTPPAAPPFPPLLQQQTGLYVQDQLRLGPWIAVVGLRHDKVTSDKDGSPLQKDNATSGRAGLMYELPFGLTPYVTYAQSFDPIFGAGMCVDFCKPQRGELHEIGFKYRVSKDLTINGALFDITEKNRLAPGPVANISIQTGKVQIRGAELELLATVFNDLDLIGAYTYLDAEVLSGSNAGRYIETVPMHQASLWAKYRFMLWGIPGFSAGAGVRYIGSSWDGTDMIETPGYVLFDAMLAWQNDKWRFQINASNLGDHIHLTTCLARGDCFYGARRTILSSLTYKF
jgi:iron complex outermembrane recepter protein